MTTAREVAKLVAPLLQRNKDLALVGRMIYITPVHHIARGIYIERTGEATRCWPTWCLWTLFYQGYTPLNIEDRIRKEEKGEHTLWMVNDPRTPDDLVRIAERDVLPMLRKVATLDDYLDALLAEGRVPFERAWSLHFQMAVARGDLAKAREWLSRDRYRDVIEPLNVSKAGLADRLLEKGDRISKRDQADLLEFLHESEEKIVKQLKIEHIWERMPFSAEAQI